MRKHDITELELEYVANVIEDYAHSMDNAQMMLGSGRRQAYAHIKRCVECGYINRKEGYLLPTQKAFRECRAPYPWHHLGRQNLRHYANIVTVREYLRNDKRFLFMGWKSERAIRRELGLPDGYEFMGAGIHIPDGIAYLTSVKTGVCADVAIEVEQSYKGPKRTDDIMTKLASEYDEIFYFATEGYVYDLIDTCIRRLPQKSFEKFSLWNLDTILLESKERLTSQHVQL